MLEFSGALPPTLEGLGSYTLFTSGEMNTAGHAIVNRNAILLGSMNIGEGVTQFNGSAAFDASAIVAVSSGGTLELNGETTFSGGSYSGDGLVQLNATTMVEAPTTLSVSHVDLDGGLGEYVHSRQ